MKKQSTLLVVLLIVVVMVCGCGNETTKQNQFLNGTDAQDNNVTETIDVSNAEEFDTEDFAVDEESETVDQETNAESGVEEAGEVEDSENFIAQDTSFLGKYDSFDAWRERHMGSVGSISDKTILVSVYLDEPDYKWDDASMEVTKKVMKIAYDFLIDTMKNDYKTEMNLLYDTDVYEDLFYQMQIEENIPVYVTTEEERRMDELEDEWIATLPVSELMEKYEADSIGFLFFVAHEGCSYSSMHFIDDGIATWDESCLLYLRDMYSPTFEYETPAVYAHELLHLYGAEDLYSDADVFSKDIYKEVQKQYPEDIMIKTYDTINGKYTIYSDEVKQKVTPITAYLVGTPGIDYPLENEELVKEEESCFSGSTYDRPF